MDVSLPAQPSRVSSSSVATVRRQPQAGAQLRSLLWSTFACRDGDPERVHDASLVLSELVGNAVRHAEGDRLQVHLRRRGDVLRMAVRDGSVAGPVPRNADLEDEGGRGLLIIEALSDRWGWQPRPGGKVVWADVPC
jgi:anti-sigma regulatory factor (Ser/Thr protein kinase)